MFKQECFNINHILRNTALIKMTEPTIIWASWIWFGADESFTSRLKIFLRPSNICHFQKEQHQRMHTSGKGGLRNNTPWRHTRVFHLVTQFPMLSSLKSSKETKGSNTRPSRNPCIWRLHGRLLALTDLVIYI